MPLSEIEEITQQKLDKIEAMLEQLVLDAALSVLEKMLDSQNRDRESHCYRADCPMRNEIPF